MVTFLGLILISAQQWKRRAHPSSVVCLHSVCLRETHGVHVIKLEQNMSNPRVVPRRSVPKTVVRWTLSTGSRCPISPGLDQALRVPIQTGTIVDLPPPRSLTP